ncbi:chymotrypsin inhibitor [Nasonia vitripennis]|uniref:TIL domain-containing protein n=1 Tax=Nasonia vitripennis TaxID=7425 RepID=A0A7M7QRZ6_NASVI|nr:chymotrypsin inhibitor [Nasonia vitripennis]XP_031776641.1 chymotrypsin inhibitor [Nasonia vitripennis]XP_032451911.1 chymotrypsin inhibitor [Nasonia vitripennis]
MSKLTVSCLLVLCICGSVITIDAASLFCRKPNQEWTECGSACPRTCDQLEDRLCIQQCIRGCRCNRGYILNNHGECVLPKYC